jgi:hypothetical protein
MDKLYMFGPDMSCEVLVRDDVVAVAVDDDQSGARGFVIRADLDACGDAILVVHETEGFIYSAVELVGE